MLGCNELQLLWQSLIESVSCVFMQIELIDAGFRSRVRYINVSDPSSMCYYISEILDAGRGWPLFMVRSPFQLLAFVMQFGLIYIFYFNYVWNISHVNLMCL